MLRTLSVKQMEELVESSLVLTRCYRLLYDDVKKIFLISSFFSW